ncbi:MAG: formate dehydrogenase subunit gamma [Desulfobulbus propionicus]|nr:MAG: formate dehydrogenase subunit gamma [Desulfobulbus propionicus]
MKKYLVTVGGLVLFCALPAAATQINMSTETLSPTTAAFQAINGELTGDWQQYGEVFTMLASTLFRQIFLALITVIPTIFFLHYLIIGAKHFDHDGPQVLYFGIISRIIHWITALSFTSLVLTGLIIIFGKYLGGGAPVMWARYIHVVAALVFACSVPFMLLIWFIDMLPAWYDILWLFILGGYLSKEKKPVPAGRFNAGQKMWFWTATVGGLVMLWSGYQLFLFEASTDELRIWAMVHNVLGMMMVALLTTHVYMSLFAIAGSIHSMIDGHKPKDEVDILHSRYKIKENPL